MTRPDITQTSIWQQLCQHHASIRQQHMRHWFASDDQRFTHMHERLPGMLVDFSKNRINEQSLSLLTQLADAADLRQWRARLFEGDCINYSEHRPALHTALRQPRAAALWLDGQNVVTAAYQALDQALDFAEQVRQGRYTGHSGLAMTDVVNIGVGGSDLGPKMVTEALQAYATAGLNIHFVSNVDGAHLTQTLMKLHPETTLFIVASKSFTTPETLLNAQAAKQWLLHTSGWSDDAVARHFVAISTNLAATQAFGITPQQVFTMFDWVGGRYSVWSTIGLPVMCAIGKTAFLQFLAGARVMDEHFQTQPWRHNIPVLLALLGVWYNNFFDAHSHAVIPYDYGLRGLTEYLQQLDMESNGKNVTQANQPVECATGSIIWGSQGVNCQHAYFQMLHQGSRLIPSDFIVPINSAYPLGTQHQVLVANAFAQSEALMRGKTLAEAEEELLQAGKDTHLAAQKVFGGNQPTTTIVLDAVTPHHLGMLIAMYEHKVFVQGVIWGINSFDQWGVEYGKVLAKTIESELGKRDVLRHDASTNALIDYYRGHHVSTTTATTHD